MAKGSRGGSSSTYGYNFSSKSNRAELDRVRREVGSQHLLVAVYQDGSHSVTAAREFSFHNMDKKDTIRDLENYKKDLQKKIRAERNATERITEKYQGQLKRGEITSRQASARIKRDIKQTDGYVARMLGLIDSANEAIRRAKRI